MGKNGQVRINIPDEIWPKFLTIGDYSDFEMKIDSLANEVEKSLVHDFGKHLPYPILVSRQDLILGVICSYFTGFGNRGREKERVPFEYAYRYLDKNWGKFIPSNIVHAFTIDEENYVFSFQRIAGALNYSQFRKLLLVAAEVFSFNSEEMCRRFIEKSKFYKHLDNEPLKEFAYWFLSEAANVVLEIDKINE